MDFLILLTLLISIQDSTGQTNLFQPCKSPFQTFGFCIPLQFVQMCPVLLGSTLSKGNCTDTDLCCYSLTGTGPSITDGSCGIKGTDTRARSSGDVELLSRITGNDVVSNAKEFCWNAYIFRKKIDGNDYLGSGTLISNDTIITSASILKSYEASDLYVLVGDLNSAPTDNCTQYRKVTSKSIHPKFSSGTLNIFDIGKLKLQSEVPIDGKCICKICLPSANENFVGKSCTVTGLGVAIESVPFNMSDIGRLKKVDVPVLNSLSCQQFIRAVLPQFNIDESQLCAGGELGKDACKGDGGSGLVCDRGNEIFTLAGIVSGGFGCGRQNVPGIYANVSSALDFINQQ